MIFSNSLEYSKLTDQLDKEHDVISIIGCNTCIRVSGAGGPEKMKELALKLRNDGYHVVDGFMLPFGCMEPYLATVKLDHTVNTVVALACTAGVSNIKRNYPNLKVAETVKNIGLIVADANKGVLKIAMPYEKYKHQLGEEYPIGSDGKNKMPTKQIPIETGVE